MNSKNLDEFSRFTNEGLIKSTDSPLQGLTSEQKALLNRKGNVLFNQGDIESAKRIFITTGYSDGLTRVGDFYSEKDKPIDALKMYWLAHNKRKAEPIIEKLALMIESIITI